MATITDQTKRSAPKSSKLGAEKLLPEEQRARFIEAAREAGCSEDEAAFDAALKKIVKPNPPPEISGTAARLKGVKL